jgi:hypothetical protein
MVPAGEDTQEAVVEAQ